MKAYNNHLWTHWKTHAVLAGVILVAAVLTAPDGHAQATGKLSKNIYRVPYANGVQVTINQDYIDHGSTPAGNTGPMDITATLAGQALVAAAPGTVTVVNDLLSDCGCDSAYGPCANSIRIQHANNEVSIYLHLAQNSATVIPGDVVSAGQVIATEGDVGWTCSPDGRSPTAGSCIPSVPAGAGNCGRHLHWEVRRVTTNELVNPMICDIASNVFVDDALYIAANCNPGNCGSDISTNGPITYSGLGSFGVFQASNSISNNGGFVTQDSASVVFRSGNRITLKPGFNAATNSYFRAEIGQCNGQ